MTMVEIWSEDTTVEHIHRYWRRCEAARHSGGVSCQQAFEGAAIPDGWVLDLETEYFLPANVVLM